MDHLTINIAYIADNQITVSQLMEDLASTKVNFNLIDASTFSEDTDFRTYMSAEGSPCFLMISDNFLKSVNCLKHSLEYLHPLIKNELVIPIILDGHLVDENGDTQIVETKFEKVKNIIKYMNYWQEKYLEMRKLKRNIPPEDANSFNIQLKIVRNISSEIGDFLQKLRDTNYYTFEEFSANNYEAFFRNFGQEVDYIDFVEHNKSTPISNIEASTTNSNGNVSATTQLNSGSTVETSIIQNDESREELEKITQTSSDLLPLDELLNTSEMDKVLAMDPSENDQSEERNSAENIIDELDVVATTEEKESSTSSTESDTANINEETQEETVDNLEIDQANIAASDNLESPTEIVVEEAKKPTEPFSFKQEDRGVITDADMLDNLTAMDPEWQQAILEEKEALEREQLGEENGDLLAEELADSFYEEEEETPLAEIAEKEERPLTDTEILALELAQTIPKTDTIVGMDTEEEIISLEDIMGEELMNAPDQNDQKNTENELANDSKVDLLSPSNEGDVEVEQEEDEELEGYFMEEEEETDEIFEEISEVQVLQSVDTLINAGKITDGINLLKETLVDAPNFGSVRYQYAAYLAKYQNNFKEASEQLSIVLEQEPNNLSARFFHGELAEAEKKYQKAETNYQKVFEADSSFPNVAYKLGILYSNFLPQESATKANYFLEAYNNDQENINALYQYGIIQNEELNQPSKAIDSFKEVLEKAPEHPFVNYDLALIYHQQKALETAFNYYQNACKINPELKTEANDEAFLLEEKNQFTKNLPLENLGKEIKEKADLKLGQGKIIKRFVAPLDSIPSEETSTISTKVESLKSEKISKVYPKAGLGKIALITGATSGIGKATAILFAKMGYNLILTGRRFSRLFQLKEQLQKEFQNDIRLLAFDIRSSDAVHSALAELEKDWYAIDILINNAGLAKGEVEIHKGQLEDWENMIDTNIKGLLYMTREIAPYMVNRRSGQIINICSLGGKEVYPNNAVYCATKHAVDALSKAMRVDLHKYNIRVSQISPGFVEDTEFSQVKHGNSVEEMPQPVKDFSPVNADNIAAIIYFMVNQPSHVNLQEIIVAGTQQANANLIDKSGRN